MKLGELIVELNTKGNTKELEKSLKQLKEAERQTRNKLKLDRELKKAETEEEKQLIRKNFAQKEEIARTEKAIKVNRERNKSLVAGIKGFTAFVASVSLAIGVLDRFVNASAKSNQSILTLAQTSGVSVDTINKYASAARSANINVSREAVAQNIQKLSQDLNAMKYGMGGEGIVQGANFLTTRGGRGFNPYGMTTPQLLEAIRTGIQGVSDIDAVTALSMFGISPELLPMFRMSKEEFDKTQSRYLSEKQAKELEETAKELIRVQDELKKAWDEIAVDLIPVLVDILRVLQSGMPIIKSLLEDVLLPIVNWLKGRFKTFKQSLDKDVAADREYLQSRIGNPIPISPINTSNRNMQINSNITNTINTTQPADMVALNSSMNSFTPLLNSVLASHW